MTDEARPRAGFWRRAIAHTIDGLCVVLPCSLLAGLLFAASHGYVQMAATNLNVSTCRSATSYPPDLDPPPPADSNFVRACETYSIAGETGHWLEVGHQVTGPGFTKSFSRSYMVDAAGQVIRGVDLSLAVPVLLLVYLIVAQWRFGRTVGLRLMRARLVVRDQPDGGRVPLARVVGRYAVLVAGAVPFVLLTGYSLYTGLSSSDDTPPNLMPSTLGTVLLVGWMLWNLVLVARKRDAVYDRVAGTALVRT